LYRLLNLSGNQKVHLWLYKDATFNFLKSGYFVIILLYWKVE